MIFRSIEIESVGPFTCAQVDLSQFSGLVAVCGHNGAGKSTFLELLVGAMYRDTPTRGSLTSLANSRTSNITVRIGDYTIRHSIDAVSGKSEAFVTDTAARQLVASGKVRDFDGWARQYLPPREILLSSIFTAQGTTGFLGMKPADRKSVLLRVLGIDKLEELATNARDRVRGSKTEAAVLSGRLVDAQARIADVADPIQLRAKFEVATVGFEIAKENLARSTEVSRINSIRADLLVRIENNRKLLEDAELIRAAAAKVTETTTMLESSRIQLSGFEKEQAVVKAAIAHALQEQDSIDTEKLVIDRKIAILNRSMAEANLIDDVAGAIDGAHAKLASAEAELAKRREQSAFATSAKRITLLREGLSKISDMSLIEVTGAPEVARETLDSDEFNSVLTPDITAQERAVDVARVNLVQIQSKAVLAQELAASRTHLSLLESRLNEVKSKELELLSTLSTLHSDAKTVAANCDGIWKLISTFTDAIQRAQTFASRASHLDAAEVRIAEITSQLPPEPPSAMSLVQATTEEAQARRELDAIRTELAIAEHGQDANTAAQCAIQELSSKLAVAELAASDWTRLAEDLGKDGLQSYEIDAAAPELTALANELLQECVGDRWTVSLETTRLSSDGKKTLEGCEIRVIDSERGRDSNAETLSGGERVVINESISLALSTLAIRRAGFENPVLVRDESGAALDPENGRAYIAMLRRASRIIGAKCVLFVSHNPELSELADYRINIKDGTITTEAVS